MVLFRCEAFRSMRRSSGEQDGRRKRSLSASRQALSGPTRRRDRRETTGGRGAGANWSPHSADAEWYASRWCERWTFEGEADAILKECPVQPPEEATWPSEPSRSVTCAESPQRSRWG